MKYDFGLRSLQALALVLFIISASFLPQNQLHAQETPAAHSLRQGSWALQYGVGSDFMLGSLLGSTISFKKHISASHAWQLGLTVGASFSSEDESDGTRELDQQALALTGHYLVYPLLTDQPAETIHFFYGAGPEIAWNRSHQSTELEQGDQADTNTYWSAGISGVVGAEWFVHQRISLNATYRSVLKYARNSRSTENVDVEARSQTRNTFQLHSPGVQLGVSVYL